MHPIPACGARAQNLARRVSGGSKSASNHQPAERATPIRSNTCPDHNLQRSPFRPLRGLLHHTHPIPAAHAAGYGLSAGSTGWLAAPLMRIAAVTIPAFFTLIAPTRADIDPLSGIDLVRITHPGNAPWAGDGTPNDRAIGRGQVNYEYSIGRFEVTTSQWVEFFNAAFDRPADDRIPHLIPPTFWGAAGATPNTPGGMRWSVPAGNEMRPVGNISWRMAAIYCNWLHNGKGTDRAAFLDGAYDVSTFGGLPLPPGGTSDQRTHHPGARYWIPTFDEVLKSFHFDPYKNGGGQGGWWLYSNGSDEPLVYGPPGALINGLPTEANAGWSDGPRSQYRVLLGAYPNTQTPWGLLDAAGATSEWNEEPYIGSGGTPVARGVDGSYWSSSLGTAVGTDAIYAPGGITPGLSTFDLGFRIASSVPTQSVGLILGAGWVFATVRRRR